MSEIIKVAFVNQPKTPQGKSGNIKTEDGRYFGVFKDKLSQFIVGQSYEIEFKPREYNGKTYHDITSAKPVTGSASNGHTGGNGGGIDWGNAKNVAAAVFRGSKVPASELIAYAREIYAATPVEVTAESTTENGGDW